MRGSCERSGEDEEQKEEEAMAACGGLSGVPEAVQDTEADWDSDRETEGTHGLGELVRDTLYLRSCRAHSVVPVSCFLRQGSTQELNLQHRGLGPQGARALASSLSSNPYVKRLDLRDNGLCGAGAEALADALSKSSSIRVTCPENAAGSGRSPALCAVSPSNRAMQKIQLVREMALEEQAASNLAELLLAHTDLKSLDLSYNQLNEQAGETLGPALAENTGLTELNVSWNHLRGLGAVAFARGLEANIFLKVLDISYNGFGDPGASAVGEALKANNVLEELNMSNNRISAMGALSLGLGLRLNQTLRILVVSRNPMRSEGCFGLLKSVQDNPASALELLDFSDIQVNAEFDGLASSVKGILPELCIKTGACRVEYKKELLPVFRPALPASVSK
ncbi:PREDICTED: LOW QUALITY PROTEIN: leucine-rich repeat-containing protein 74B [Rhinopithecus bieti]|uniref:LOW QUALITY PROTEIN: leucine-rich repeat-containing protein 74B n=1 Tax=Rhinopithecus bieti TaxID=61621 RepID=UPI00083BBD2F|nr:PREDICTED: LOW QUALITY PROTEIN: leucine-rich repeat-containing protein 74B [Rhinopithecus bieti]